MFHTSCYLCNKARISSVPQLFWRLHHNIKCNPPKNHPVPRLGGSKRCSPFKLFIIFQIVQTVNVAVVGQRRPPAGRPVRSQLPAAAGRAGRP